MYRVELQHWWYQGMHSITRSVLDRWYSGGSGLRILDAGCGTGAGMLNTLSKYGNPYGVDLSPLALGFCRQRDLSRLACSSVVRLPFCSEQFDLVTSFDVLCHASIADDGQAAAELGRVLRRGGRLVLRLPACQWLSSMHDRAVHTVRRYNRASAAGLLAKAGLMVEYLGYANCLLFPLAAAKRLAGKLRLAGGPAPSDLDEHTGPVEALFGKILGLEASLIPAWSLPFGLTVIAVGRK